MGDMADMLVEQGIMEMDDDDGLWEDPTDLDSFEPTPGWGFRSILRYTGGVRCKYCGRTGFYWAEVAEGQWRLHTPTGKVHSCQAYHERTEQ